MWVMYLRFQGKQGGGNWQWKKNASFFHDLYWKSVIFPYETHWKSVKIMQH